MFPSNPSQLATQDLGSRATVAVVPFSRACCRVNEASYIKNASVHSLSMRAPSIIEEAPENPRPARMLQLSQRLGFDLADALARDRELTADLLQRAVSVHADAKAHA